MKKKLVSALLCVAMVSSLLAGCGGSGDAPAADSGTDAGDEAAGAAEDTSDASGDEAAASDSGASASSDYSGTVRMLNFKPEISDAMPMSVS